MERDLKIYQMEYDERLLQLVATFQAKEQVALESVPANEAFMILVGDSLNSLTCENQRDLDPAVRAGVKYFHKS